MSTRYGRDRLVKINLVYYLITASILIQQYLMQKKSTVDLEQIPFQQIEEQIEEKKDRMKETIQKLINSFQERHDFSYKKCRRKNGKFIKFQDLVNPEPMTDHELHYYLDLSFKINKIRHDCLRIQVETWKKAYKQLKDSQLIHKQQNDLEMKQSNAHKKNDERQKKYRQQMFEQLKIHIEGMMAETRQFMEQNKKQKQIEQQQLSKLIEERKKDHGSIILEYEEKLNKQKVQLQSYEYKIQTNNQEKNNLYLKVFKLLSYQRKLDGISKKRQALLNSLNFQEITESKKCTRMKEYQQQE